jgi:epsilon-lactone hydrolase
MKIIGLSALIPFAMTAAFSVPAIALDASVQPTTDFTTLEAIQNTANAKPGPRTVPGRSIPVPNTASPELQAAIAAPYRAPAWDANPKSAAEWKELINKLAAAAAVATPQLTVDGKIEQRQLSHLPLYLERSSYGPDVFLP